MRAVNESFTTSFRGTLIFLTLCFFTGNPAAAPLCVAPPAGLVSWWTADGNANDIVGGNHGTVESGANFAAGHVAQAFLFSGVNGGGGINLGNVPAFEFTQASSFTIETWINSIGSTIAPNDAQAILLLNNNCGNELQGLSISTGDRAAFQVRDAAGVNAGALFRRLVCPRMHGITLPAFEKSRVPETS